MILDVVFWACAAAIVYAYVGYPALAWAVARRKERERPAETIAITPQPVSLVMSVFNEEGRIAARAAQLSQLLAGYHPQSELIVVSDGSTDATAARLRELALPNVRLIEQPQNLGKAEALNRGVAAAGQEIIVFADVRQTWDGEAIRRLVGRFGDPAVTGVSGDLELRSVSGELASVGVYWRLEKLLRTCESCWHSSIGVTGAICAARRSRFPRLPPGTVLDDVYWPLAMVLAGGKIVHEPHAKAFDCLPPNLAGEYRRKLRTLAGNFQLVASLPGLLRPWNNPVWLQFVSHKLMRLAVPWLFLVCLGISGWQASRPLYGGLLAAELVLVGVGLLAWFSGLSRKNRWLGLLASLCALNVAAWLAFWVWLLGGTKNVWSRVNYAGWES